MQRADVNVASLPSGRLRRHDENRDANTTAQPDTMPAQVGSEVRAPSVWPAAVGGALSNELRYGVAAKSADEGRFRSVRRRRRRSRGASSLRPLGLCARLHQGGVVFQKDLGPKTTALAKAIKKYDPDSTWTSVDDAGTRPVEAGAKPAAAN